MNQTTSEVTRKQPLKTRGHAGKDIYGELLQFIKSPAVLTFDNKPYDNSQAELEYSSINIDGAAFGFIQQPDPGFNTTWVDVNDNDKTMSGSAVKRANRINVITGS